MKGKRYAGILIVFTLVLTACETKSSKNINAYVSESPVLEETKSSSEETGKPEDAEVDLKEVSKEEADESITDESLLAMQSQMKEENKQLAAAFLGYSLGEGTVDIKAIYNKAYPFLETAWEERYEAYDGDEFYALVPQSKEWKLAVYELTYNDDCMTGEEGKCLYEAEDGNAIILRCNMSDLYANVRVKVSKGEEIFTWEPRVSLQDKAVLIGASWIHDFSLYEEAE